MGDTNMQGADGEPTDRADAVAAEEAARGQNKTSIITCGFDDLAWWTAYMEAHGVLDTPVLPGGEAARVRLLWLDLRTHYTTRDIMDQAGTQKSIYSMHTIS